MYMVHCSILTSLIYNVQLGVSLLLTTMNSVCLQLMVNLAPFGRNRHEGLLSDCDYLVAIIFFFLLLSQAYSHTETLELCLPLFLAPFSLCNEGQGYGRIWFQKLTEPLVSSRCLFSLKHPIFEPTHKIHMNCVSRKVLHYFWVLFVIRTVVIFQTELTPICAKFLGNSYYVKASNFMCIWIYK